ATGRGYDSREYAPFHVSFADNQGIFEEGLEVVRKLWAAEDRISHHGKHYSFDDVRITPKPVQRPIPTYVGSFSKPSIELAARLECGLIVAPFAAAMSFGGLKQVADLYCETCAKYGNTPGRLMCSYFTHFADSKAEEDAQRARQIRYYKECVIPAFPGDPKTAPPSYRYFINIVERLRNVRPEDLTENSVLLGTPSQITDTLKKVEAAGFSEVILYFNVGLKPHAQVKEEMDRFMVKVECDEGSYLFPAGKPIIQLVFSADGPTIHIEAVYPFNESRTSPRIVSLDLEDARELARRLVDAIHQARTQLVVSSGTRIAI